MSGFIEFLVVIICLVAIALIVLLITLAIRVRRLVDDVQTRLDNQIAPLLTQTTEVMRKANSVVTRVAHLSDMAGAATQFVESGITKISPHGAGRKFATRLGQHLAVWAAGLGKAAAAAKQPKGAEGKEGIKDYGSPTIKLLRYCLIVDFIDTICCVIVLK